jgi:hypothetical protein
LSLPSHLVHGQNILCTPCSWAHVNSHFHNLSSFACCLFGSCICHPSKGSSIGSSSLAIRNLQYSLPLQMFMLKHEINGREQCKSILLQKHYTTNRWKVMYKVIWFSSNSLQTCSYLFFLHHNVIQHIY